MKAIAFGLPKLGEKREFKKLLEDFWKGNISEEELHAGMRDLALWRADLYKENADVIPSNELSYYDFMLDTALMVGAVPQRFGEYKGMETYFEMARGKSALEMTKWFNTNYHYLVPEIEREEFKLFINKPLNDYEFYKQKGYETAPHIIGAYTFLRMSKALRRKKGELPLYEIEKIEDRDQFERLTDKLVPVYREVLESLKKAGCQRVHIEEPALVLDTEDWQWDIVEKIYSELSKVGIEIALFTYYDSVSDYERYTSLPVQALHFDLVSNKENLQNIKEKGFPKDKELIAGIINGRQPWRADLSEKLRTLEDLSKLTDNLSVSNSCPLYHLPVSVEPEEDLPEGLKERLSFAKEKLKELRVLKTAFGGDKEALKEVEATSKLLEVSFGENAEVRRRITALKDEDFRREVPYEERDKLQRDILKLPLFPTTTIGSYPQTPEVRKMRTAYRTGKISESEYKEFIKKQIEHVIAFQEEVGLDVLVHGEFERTDMVEFFAFKLDGIATTKHGWVLSYGSRVYRPPIIYGDVSRPKPMTLEEITYAQSLTDKPVKGMLTGPVTILNWSYYREDVPKRVIAYQIALALLDEVSDLEGAGIKIIQIDEPAFREGVPLKRKDWQEYFNWAVKAFRLSSRAKPQTQIHTHMCYSEFNEIIEYIYQMDFDVISIEASRSKGEIISAFEKFKGWDRQIGIGVYDIHSPAIPTKEEMKAVMERSMKVLPKELLWVNPDCGLKTRRWEEVEPALKNMVEMAKGLREEVMAGV
ncbi:5-methyltetrahydropteroyltriglutamate--homocysteine S-methyltransferase [Hydrogenivirga sp. 128-5-R1-1]|uniref:5-methyltetrahydropteroyltriglutamate-- homocysteine S-methyltransferase n=1 Tax=Hydrogenivirga sp. 128-5-R1-1 TaxID=392423 RepID=UPI00015EF7F4|nr:5-methyltetrahydropteroyltriglutamate--homocysteine S-methyltransferase [Hydrogenivirga sp. 128-5-R1-1]EDP75756.1 5-methyltetrahydropteroyltriglutamate--homocysteine methyltransferase [Hydrogenivirga sp. 128-5-R1-1]